MTSPFDDPPYVLLDAAAGPSNGDSDMVTWLRRLPCPSIAIDAAGVGGKFAAAADVVVNTARDADLLTGSIRSNPIAACVLVQLLRATETMPVADALVAESLAYATLQGGAEFQRWLAIHRAESPAVPTDSGPAVVMSRDNDDLRLELNRPSNRNAINVEMRDALVEALQLAIADESLKSIHLSGRGKCFSVGGDLTEFGSFPNPAAAHAIRSITMPGKFLAECADRVECHVHGACIGSGVELPAFARRVTAAPDSFFHLPELGFGLIPGGGGCVSIPRRIGRQRTAWMVLSGRRINARTALDWGLVDEII